VEEQAVKVHKHDPIRDELIATIEAYEKVRIAGGPEALALADDIAWMLQHEWPDMWIDHNGVRYRLDGCVKGDLERDTKYRKPEYGWRRAHKVAA
jgi:hypothetical protein